MTLGRRLPLVVASFFVLLGTAPSEQAFCEIAESPSALPTQVNGTQVDILLTEGHARVVIIKEFYNPSTVFKEGQVVFPLEQGHELITDLRLRIGNMTYASSSIDRREGLEAVLESIRNEREAAVVQYDPTRDVYWIAVTIPPREARTTVTTLEMPLKAWDGAYEYVYRLAVDARHSVDYLRVHVRVETTSRLREADSPSHPGLSFLRDGDLAADAHIETLDEAQSRDLTVRFRTEGRSVSQAVSAEGDRYVRWSTSVDDPIFAGSLASTPRALLFLMDGSGSMGREGRWTLAREIVRTLAGELRPDERFGLALFHGRVVVPFARSLEEWSGDTARSVEVFLSEFQPRGSTNLAGPVELVERWAREAVADGQQPVVFLISDGRITSGPTGFELSKQYSRIASEVSLPVFSIAVKPLRHEDENNLFDLSHLRGGEFAVVGEGRPGETARELLGRLRVPVLEGVSLEISGTSNATWATPSRQSIPKGGEILGLARLRGTASEPLAVRVSWGDGVGGLQSFEEMIPGEDIPVQPLVERQWVLARIQALLARLRNGPDASLSAQLNELAMPYHVATPLTSLLVTVPAHGSPPSGPGSPESSVAFALPTPLVAEAQRAAGFRRDLESPLVVEGEIDWFVSERSEEYGDIANALRDPTYAGTFLTVYDLDGTLVGVQRGWLDPLAFPSHGIPLALAVIAGSAACVLHVIRRKYEVAGRTA